MSSSYIPGALLLGLFVPVTVNTCLAQHLERPQPVRLRVVVSYEDGRTKVPFATVELMDAVGSSSAMDKRLTDQSGQVDFNTLTGLHRIRITGAELQPYEGEFEIAPMESYHLENFAVRRKSEGIATHPEGMNAIPAIRLRIPENARKEFEQGSRAIERKKWDEGRKHFQAAIDLYPDYDLAYNGLGSVYWQLNDKPAARQAFVKANELNDKFPGAQRNLARILLAEHNYAEAASLLSRSLEIEPTNAWALENVAYAELQLHRFKDAAEHALRVHTMPHDGLANAHVIAGYALEALGQPQAAAEQWKLYLREDPNGPNAKRAQAAAARLSKDQQP